ELNISGQTMALGGAGPSRSTGHAVCCAQGKLQCVRGRVQLCRVQQELADSRCAVTPERTKVVSTVPGRPVKCSLLRQILAPTRGVFERDDRSAHRLQPSSLTRRFIEIEEDIGDA